MAENRATPPLPPPGLQYEGIQGDGNADTENSSQLGLPSHEHPSGATSQFPASISNTTATSIENATSQHTETSVANLLDDEDTTVLETNSGTKDPAQMSTQHKQSTQPKQASSESINDSTGNISPESGPMADVVTSMTPQLSKSIQSEVRAEIARSRELKDLIDDRIRRTRLPTFPESIKNHAPQRLKPAPQSKPRSEERKKVEDPQLSIQPLTSENFKSNTPTLRDHPKRPGHSIAEISSRPLYVIEILMKSSIGPGFRPRRERHIGHTASKIILPETSPQDLPDRIRIRSPFMLSLLHDISNGRLSNGGDSFAADERTSLVFLYPFKFFITHADNIVEERKRVSTAVEAGESAIEAGEDGVGSIDTKKTLEHLDLLVKLLQTDLKPIIELREKYRNAEVERVAFQDLWLLFNVGGLAYYRNPHPHSPPCIVRVTQFDGGRQILNNDNWKSTVTKRDARGPHSKGKENRFFIRYYNLEFDGEHYGPVEDDLAMPAWEGERNIHDLKVFPLQFCRPQREFNEQKFGDLVAFKAHLVKRGKDFLKLDAISHRHYSGRVIGPQNEIYNSQVVIDFKLRNRESGSKPGILGLLDSLISESHLSTGLNVSHGDPREVQEGTPLLNGASECRFPGCDGNDFIHDDILLDNDIAHEHIEEYGLTKAKFTRDDVNAPEAGLKDEDHMLFPTFVHGYVLNSRNWAKLDLDLLKGIGCTSSGLDALHIPQLHKTNLKAVVDMCNVRSFGRPALDIVPGKGEGIVVLLYGPPGVGKTATAEVIAADTNRPLYPITYADLGRDVSEIEKNLKKIFRYAQRWNCVLLLDEADVFLMPRDKSSTERNSIVSVFLRNLEWYPGLIFLTTNHLEQFDEGVLDRVQLPLRYPKLNKKFTKKIFEDHIARINKSHEADKDLPPQTGADCVPRYAIDDDAEKEIHKWWKTQYKGAHSPQANDHGKDAGKDGAVNAGNKAVYSNGWWNGRQIRAAFQMAGALAEQDMIKSQGKIASIQKRHFESVKGLKEDFQRNLVLAKEERENSDDDNEDSE